MPVDVAGPNGAGTNDHTLAAVVSRLVDIIERRERCNPQPDKANEAAIGIMSSAFTGAASAIAGATGGANNGTAIIESIKLGAEMARAGTPPSTESPGGNSANCATSSASPRN